MSTVAEKPITAEDLFAVPRDGLRKELLRGTVKTMSPSGFRHGVIAARLGTAIADYVRRNELGTVCAAETGFILDRNPDVVRAPDVAFIKADKVPASDIVGFAEMAPDLAVEVLSPSDRFSEVEEKARCWLRYGSTEVWVVDAENRRVLIYQRGPLIKDLTENDMIEGGDLLPGFELKVADIFVR